LIVLDVQPLFGGDADYRLKYTRPIAQFLQAHQPYLFWGGYFPASGLLCTRPKETEVVKTGVFVTLKDYLAADGDLVDRAQPVTGSSKLDII
jgi:phycoerythrobilin:ferredoxin oxidoreductase